MNASTPDEDTAPTAEVETPETGEVEGAEPAAPLDTDDEPETETETEAESFIREIPGGAGHGPARAYGYVAIATALGAEAELTAGGTRSTSRNPLQVTVTAPAQVFERVNEVYDVAYPVAEQVAAAKRGELRKSGRAIRSSYDVSLLTRAVLAGFLQGVGSAFREPGTTRPAPFREATRARLSDESAHRAGVSAGRAWAKRNLTTEDGESEREDQHSAA